MWRKISVLVKINFWPILSQMTPAVFFFFFFFLEPHVLETGQADSYVNCRGSSIFRENHVPDPMTPNDTRLVFDPITIIFVEVSS